VKPYYKLLFLLMAVLAILCAKSMVTVLAACSPRCELYTDLQGNKCANLDCGLGCSIAGSNVCQAIPGGCGTGSYVVSNLTCGGLTLAGPLLASLIIVPQLKL
jgi:hypothetical protein